MQNAIDSINKGFSKISHRYEQLNSTTGLINWKRKRIRKHFTNILNTNGTILEINCGSGIDAIYLAKKGYTVHATDAADGMIDYVRSKINSEKLENSLSCEILTFNELHKLNEKKYSHIFSNFGGLNFCTLNELDGIFKSFLKILEPNGTITLVIMPKICLWEFLRVFKGNKNAFRRLKKNGVMANIEGEKIKTYYHSFKDVKSLLSDNFSNFKAENICFIGPTSNRANFVEKRPVLFKIVKVLDKVSNMVPFFRGCGDYYVISAKKK